MKVRTCLFCIITVVSMQFSIAQISVETETIFTAIIEEPDLVAHNTFTNQIPQLKTFRLVREEIDITEGWSTTICDKNLCYVPSVKTAEVELDSGASSILDLHCIPILFMMAMFLFRLKLKVLPTQQTMPKPIIYMIRLYLYL